MQNDHEKKHLSGKGVILYPPPPPPMNIGVPELSRGFFDVSPRTWRILNPLRWFRKDSEEEEEEVRRPFAPPPDWVAGSGEEQ